MGAPFSATAAGVAAGFLTSVLVLLLPGFVIRFTRLALFAVGRHGFRIEVEPFDGFERRRMDAHVFHLGDEVENVAAVLALAETIPDVFADADAELRRVAAFVNRAWTTQTIRAALELVEDAVMLQDLFHGDGRLDSLEVNEL